MKVINKKLLYLLLGITILLAIFFIFQNKSIKYKNEQVRNNNLKYKDGMLKKFDEDSVFKNFKDSNKSPDEYEQWLLKEASNKGINTGNLKQCMDVIKKGFKNNEVTMYPVIIETINYKNKPSFILVFTWDFNDSINMYGSTSPSNRTVKFLGHILVVAIEAESKTIIDKLECL